MKKWKYLLKVVMAVGVIAMTAVQICTAAEGTAHTWNRSNTVAGYEIYRSSSADGTYKKIAVVPNGKGAYTDTKVGSNKTYYYKVRAYKPVDGSYVYGDYSKTIAITIK